MAKDRKIPASDDAWDSGELGRDESFAKIADDIDDAAIDGALELVPVSIRLQRSLIDDFKIISQQHGIGYQPLMRQVLTRFAVCETRQMANDLLLERKKARAAEKANQPQRKQASL